MNNHMPLPSEPPIHRLPEDALRGLFEWAAILSEDNSFHTAVGISHVCRMWRQISLETSFLWARVNLRTRDDGTVIKHIVDNVFPRMGSRPPSLIITVGTSSRIRGPDEKFVHKMSILQLNQFKRIKCLHFHLISDFAMKVRRNSFGISYSSGPLEELFFSSSPGLKDAQFHLNLSFLPNLFPTAKAIKVSYMPIRTIVRHIHTPIERLTVRFTEINWVSLVFSGLTALTELTLVDTFLWILSRFERIPLPSLQLLNIQSENNDDRCIVFPWEALRAPKLVKLYLNYRITDAEIAFITRNTTIKWISGWFTDETFTELSFIAPQIEALQTMPSPTPYRTGELLIFIPPPSQDS